MIGCQPAYFQSYFLYRNHHFTTSVPRRPLTFPAAAYRRHVAGSDLIEIRPPTNWYSPSFQYLSTVVVTVSLQYTTPCLPPVLPDRSLQPHFSPAPIPLYLHAITNYCHSSRLTRPLFSTHCELFRPKHPGWGIPTVCNIM